MDLPSQNNLPRPPDFFEAGSVAHADALPKNIQRKVSVFIVAYNHGKFIAQAIDGVLMQKMDFSVEIVIGDDCSTDNTREIVKAYAEKYPNVIHALLHERNVGMNGNYRALHNACHGEFIAMLDGDDYWTDPYKLQKQIVLMEQNPQYSMCGTAVQDVVMLADGTEQKASLYPEGDGKSLYSLEDVLAGYPFRTLTFVLRNGLVTLPGWFDESGTCDMCLSVLYAEKGPVAYLNEVTGIYRKHVGGVWSGASAYAQCKVIRKTLTIFNDHFSGRYFKVLRRHDFDVTKRVCLELMQQGYGRDARKIYWESFAHFVPYMPLRCFSLGVFVYGGGRYMEMWYRLTIRLAIRTRFKRLLGIRSEL